MVHHWFCLKEECEKLQAKFVKLQSISALAICNNSLSAVVCSVNKLYYF